MKERRVGGEWIEYTIEDIADVVGGGTPSTKDPSNFNGDIPWITPKDLSGVHSRYVSRGSRNLSKKGLESCSARLLPRNSILLSTRAPIGYVSIAANPIATNQGFRSLVLKEGFDPEFVYYWLKLNTPELERHASGSTFKELSGSALKQIRIRLPRDKNEQRAIARILGTLDDKIELNRRMNETLEAMAQALFRSWFVDFDPVIVNAIKAGNPIPEKFAKRAAHYRDNPDALGLPEDILNLFPDRFVDSELGPIPEGWEVKALGEFMDVNPSRPLAKGTIAPYIDMANMPTRGHIPLAIRERAFTSGAKFINGDTLLARITPCLENGKTAFVDFLEEHQVGWGSTEFIVLRPKQPFPPIFGYMISRDPTFREYAIQSMTGSSGRQRVQISAIKNYLLPCPTEKIARAFGHQAQPLFKTVKVKSDESRTLAALRDTLLPKLISGELRVPDVEKILEEVE